MPENEIPPAMLVDIYFIFLYGFEGKDVNNSPTKVSISKVFGLQHGQ